MKFANVNPNQSHIMAEPQSPPQTHAHLPLSAATSALQTEEMVALVAHTVFNLLDKCNIAPYQKTKPAVLTKAKAPVIRLEIA